jgi:hypothetical protein
MSTPPRVPHNPEEGNSDLVQSISKNLGAIFRHLFPGILIMGAAAVAHPSWFRGIVDFRSWQHIIVAAVVALAAGNIWFAINRYGIHQFADWLMYLCKWQGPARSDSWLRYTDDLGNYVAESLCTDSISSRARQHVTFRASSILLLYTVAEVGGVAACWKEPKTLFATHPYTILLVSALIFVVAIWQDVLTRRIDYHVVHFGHTKARM